MNATETIQTRRRVTRQEYANLNRDYLRAVEPIIKRQCEIVQMGFPRYIDQLRGTGFLKIDDGLSDLQRLTIARLNGEIMAIARAYFDNIELIPDLDQD